MVDMELPVYPYSHKVHCKDLNSLVFHESGHIVANARIGCLFQRLMVRPDHMEGYTANLISFALGKAFPNATDAAIEQRRDQEADIGILLDSCDPSTFSEQVALQAQEAREQAQMLATIPLPDRLMAYAAGYEAETLYEEAAGANQAILQALRAEAEQSQDTTNMRRIIQERLGTREEVQTYLQQAQRDARSFLLIPEIARVWKLTASDLIAVLTQRPGGDLECRVKWYELTETTRTELTALSR